MPLVRNCLWCCKRSDERDEVANYCGAGHGLHIEIPVVQQGHHEGKDPDDEGDLLVHRRQDSMGNPEDSSWGHWPHVVVLHQKERDSSFPPRDDLEMTFTDDVIGIQAHEKAVEDVITFDRDFEILGLTTLPQVGG